MRKSGKKICRKIFLGKNGKKKILLVGIISFIVLIASTPLVFAVTEDTLVITFDPDSDIDIDVSLATYNYSSVTVNAWTNTTGEVFTLYNNGTIPMDTDIRADNETAEGDMQLNESGVVPGTDQFAIYIEDLTSPGYLNQSYVAEFDDDLAPNADTSFDICLLMGTNTSLNHTWQTETIYFRGRIHS